MAEPAIKRMTLDEFLHWDDGTDTRYELIDGLPVAMAPPARAHAILCARLGGRIDAALRSRRPCTAQTEAGIARPDRDDSCYIADVAVTCRALQRGEQLIQDPILIVEILSPSTERHDRRLNPGLSRDRERAGNSADRCRCHHAEIFRREKSAVVHRVSPRTRSGALISPRSSSDLDGGTVRRNCDLRAGNGDADLIAGLF